MVGIYIHIPFCGKKCPYCDFYSTVPSKSKMAEYTDAAIRQMEEYRCKNVKGKTLYFGGGTPNLIGSENLCRLIDGAREIFQIENGAEITVEANPATVTKDFLEDIYSHGANRLSLGMQSSNDEELKALGRRHTPERVREAVSVARDAGFKNISLDLMIGTPKQTMESLKESIRFCAELGVEHVSAYMLKIEEGTPFFEQRESLSVADEDTVSDMYLTAVDELERFGFKQYEVSNFSKEGCEGKHNLIYWRGEEYLGFGASAHSFINGKRYFYSPDIEAVISGEETIFDCNGGDREEYLMLRMRLSEGLSDKIWMDKFGEHLPLGVLKKAHLYEKAGLIKFRDASSFSCTKQGYLVSNTIIMELIDSI